MKKAISARRWAKKARTQTIVILLPALEDGGEPTEIEVLKDGVNLISLTDALPMSLLSKVMASSEEGGSENGNYSGEESAALAIAMNKMRKLIPFYVVSPKVILDGDPKDGEIHIAEIPSPHIDKLIKLMMRTEEAEELEPFRNGSERPATRPPVQAVQPPSV